MASEAAQSAAPVHRFILLTDIVQSSRLAEQYGQDYLAALELGEALGQLQSLAKDESLAIQPVARREVFKLH
jgi:hypothetical protein